MKRAILWGLASVGIFLPAILGVLIAVTPDTLIAKTDAGEFVESTGATIGWFFSGGATTVQTTTASIVVGGQFSAARGTPVAIERRLKSGDQLCLQIAHHCARIAGAWPGEMMPVPHRHHITDWLAQRVGAMRVVQWMFIGLFAWLLPFTLTVRYERQTLPEGQESRP